jgi:hypothetical protein
MEYAEEKYATVQPEISDLLKKHWEEVALDRDVIKLDPAWDQYQLLDSIGVLHITTVRSNGRLVGYYINVIKEHLHYKQSRTAFSDVFFIEEQYRFTGGVRMFKAMEGFMKAKGVEKIYCTHKLHVNDQIGGILLRLGYRHIENVWSKMIGEAA